MKKLTIVLLLLLSFSFDQLKAEACIPQKPNPPRLVNDFANILDPVSKNNLERILVRFNDTTSTQIAIVTVSDLCGYDRASFTYEIGESWGVGNAKFGNGIVVMVKPKLPHSKGEVFIATGYGLEGVLPDATAKRIVNNEMIPLFKKGDYTGGITSAVKVIMEIVGGEYSAKNYNDRSKKDVPLLPILFVLFFIFIMIVTTISRAKRYGTKNNLGLWTALWLMSSANNKHTGRYHDFRSGGGGFGGGFGGFGGGSFGGGGAGGSW